MLLAAGAVAAATPAPIAKPAPSVRESTLRAHTRFLADDLLEGRGTGERGGTLAARYIAAQLEAMGLAPAGVDGSYFQPVSLVGVRLDPATTLKVSSGTRSESLRLADEFVAWTGAQKEEVAIDAEMVFAGYGIDAPDQNWNDWKGDPSAWQGKIVVMLVNDPPATGLEPQLFGGKALTYYGRWTYKFEEAARRGAAGVILLHSEESAGYGWNVTRASNTAWKYDLERDVIAEAASSAPREPRLEMKSWVTDAAARKIFALGGHDFDALRTSAATREFRPVPLGLNAKIRLKSELKLVAAPNVAAAIRGRDPKRKEEWVVVSSHWDHLGIAEPDATGDRIYNGAVDNATGVAAVLGMAEALAALPVAQRPKRSVLFLFTTAEEQGLLGATHYAKNPLVPVEKTAADMNLDGMNVHGRTRDIVAMGADRSTLGIVVAALAKERGMSISPDGKPEQGLFFRGDNLPFARAGIPALRIGSGAKFVDRPDDWGETLFREFNTARYHQPSDQYDPAWDLSGMVQEADFAMALVRKIADSDAMPKYLRGDEFARE